MKDKQDFILFCDNLEEQTVLLFQEDVQKSRGIIWYGIKNATDLWQLVDVGMGRLLNLLVFHEQQHSAFEIHLGNQQMSRLLPSHIYVF